MSSSEDEFEAPVYVGAAQRDGPILEQRPDTRALSDAEAPVRPRVDTDVLNPEPVDDPRDVDDSDAHVDSPLDAAAWRLREVLRLQRDRGHVAAEEPASVPAPEADPAGDAEVLPQRYYHRGAFFQDGGDARTAELLARDYNQPTARDVAAAQATQQGTGRRGRSKWTHLAAEDTTDRRYTWGNVHDGAGQGAPQ